MTAIISAKIKNQKDFNDLSSFGLTSNITIIENDEISSKYELKIKNNSSSDFNGIIRVEYKKAVKNAKFFMPAFMYNRNGGNRKMYECKDKTVALFPQIQANTSNPPYSNYWSVRSDRLSHPCSIVYDNANVFGVSAPPLSTNNCVFNGFTCELGENSASAGFTLGSENAPWMYLWINKIVDQTNSQENNYIILKPQDEIKVIYKVYDYKATVETDINLAIRDVYKDYHQSPRDCKTVKETVKDVATAIYEDAYVDDVKTYSTRVFMKNNEVFQEPLASISWTGGIEVAAPMLMCAGRLGHEEMRNQALLVVENIIENSLNINSSLPYDAYDSKSWYTQGWWDGFMSQSGHSSYLVGQALYYILQAYEVETKFFNTKHESWLSFVKNCLNHIENTKDENGEVPYIWSSIDGKAVEYDSFAGCWCVAAQAYFNKITNSKTYPIEKSITHYFNDYVKIMECYGTPVDTLKAVDSEGSLAFIKACKFAHEITKDEKYLEMLKFGMEYEFTFKFCWNVPIQIEPLKKIGWSSCGGSVTSTCNPHIHPMSNNVCDELYYLYNLTNDEYYNQRLKDTVKWALQTYSCFDGEYDYGKKGWMSERFCHSEGLLVEKYPDGSVCSTWKCFLPWGATNILEGLCGAIWEC